jgi:hypothetical protein
MRAACENCGKFGEMEPGKPFVCCVCGHFHDLRTVGSRIAAVKDAAAKKAKADREARKREEKAAAERTARIFRPKTVVPPSPRRASPRPFLKVMGESRSGSCVGGCLGTFGKFCLCILGLGIIIGSCLSSKPVKNVAPSVDRTIQGEGAVSSSPTQEGHPITPLPRQPSPTPKPLPGKHGSSAGQKTIWQPGARHPKQPHVHAGNTPGQWVLDDGYVFVYPGTSDWTVRKVVKSSPCAKCSGTGVSRSFLKCVLCNGKRTYPTYVPEIDRRTGVYRLVTRNMACPACKGSGGTHIDVVCPNCNGASVVLNGRR